MPHFDQLFFNHYNKYCRPKQPHAWVQLLEEVHRREDIAYHLADKLQMLQRSIIRKQQQIEKAEKDLEFEKKAFALINAARKRAKKRRLKVPV